MKWKLYIFLTLIGVVDSTGIYSKDFELFSRAKNYIKTAEESLKKCGPDEQCRIDVSSGPIVKSLAVLPRTISDNVLRYVRGQFHLTFIHSYVENVYLNVFRRRFGSVVDDLDLCLKFFFNKRTSEFYPKLTNRGKSTGVIIGSILGNLRRGLKVSDKESEAFWDATNTLIGYGSDVIKLVLDGPGEMGEKCGTMENPSVYLRSASFYSAFRVVGGLPIQKGEYKFLVTVMYRGGVVCAATILDSTHILTAAHCTRRMEPHQVTVGVAEYDITDPDGEQIFQVSEIVRHPYYDGLFKNDICMLTLERPIQGVANAKPVCLPKGEECQVLRGRRCIVMGWGANSNRNNKLRFPNIPHDGVVRVYHGAVCPFSPRPANRRTQICASGASDTCNGDSGGPLVCDYDGRWVQCGVTSYGPKQCNEPNTNGIYTSVTQFQPWIKRVTAQVQFGG